MDKLILVVQREYIKVVRKPTFWIATLLLPIFIGVVSFVSGYSAESAEKKVREEVENVQRVLVVDESNLVASQLYTPPYEKYPDLASAIQLVQEAQADAVFYYPADFHSSYEIKIYAPNKGIFALGRFDKVATQFIKQSVLMTLDDSESINLFNTSFQIESTYFENGEEVSVSFEQYVVPVVAVVLYFLLVFMASGFLLMSVAEEKENRMMELVLTIVKPVHLVGGKIIALAGVVVTQVIVLVILSGAVLSFTLDKLPFTIDLASVPLDPVQIVLSLFYIGCGFMIMATLMVGVGAAMPTYKEAQSFSSFFVILSIFPIYFASIIIAEPNGLVARLVSYFPLTSPMIFLVRNALGELPMLEVIISIPMLLFFVAAGFGLAFKLFELGALEYNQKISWKRLC